VGQVRGEMGKVEFASGRKKVVADRKWVGYGLRLGLVGFCWLSGVTWKG